MLTKDVHGNNHMISIHMRDGIFMNLFPNCLWFKLYVMV